MDLSKSQKWTADYLSDVVSRYLTISNIGTYDARQASYFPISDQVLSQLNLGNYPNLANAFNNFSINALQNGSPDATFNQNATNVTDFIRSFKTDPKALEELKSFKVDYLNALMNYYRGNDQNSRDMANRIRQEIGNVNSKNANQLLVYFRTSTAVSYAQYVDGFNGNNPNHIVQNLKASRLISPLTKYILPNDALDLDADDVDHLVLVSDTGAYSPFRVDDFEDFAERIDRGAVDLDRYNRHARAVWNARLNNRPANANRSQEQARTVSQEDTQARSQNNKAPFFNYNYLDGSVAESELQNADNKLGFSFEDQPFNSDRAWAGIFGQRHRQDNVSQAGFDSPRVKFSDNAVAFSGKPYVVSLAGHRPFKAVGNYSNGGVVSQQGEAADYNFDAVHQFGNQPSAWKQTEKSFEQYIERLAQQHDYLELHSGMGAGADLVWAQAIVRVRERLGTDKIHFVADVPYSTQFGTGYVYKAPNEPNNGPVVNINRQLYSNLLQQADAVVTYGDKRNSSLFEKRSQGMMANADEGVAFKSDSAKYGGTANTIYDMKHYGLSDDDITVIHPEDNGFAYQPRGTSRQPQQRQTQANNNQRTRTNNNNSRQSANQNDARTETLSLTRDNNDPFIPLAQSNDPDAVVSAPQLVHEGNQDIPFYGIYVRENTSRNSGQSFLNPIRNSELLHGTNWLRKYNVSDNSFVSKEEFLDAVSSYLPNDGVQRQLENSLSNLTHTVPVQYMDVGSNHVISANALEDNPGLSKNKSLPDKVDVLATKDADGKWHGITISQMRQITTLLGTLSNAGIDYTIQPDRRGHGLVAKLSDNLGLRIRFLDLETPYLIGEVENRNGDAFDPKLSSVVLENDADNNPATTVFHKYNQSGRVNPAFDHNGQFNYPRTTLRLDPRIERSSKQTMTLRDYNDSLREYMELPDEIKDAIAVGPLVYAAGLNPNTVPALQKSLQGNSPVSYISASKDGSTVGLGKGFVINGNVGNFRRDYNHSAPIYSTFRRYNRSSTPQVRVNMDYAVDFQPNAFNYDSGVNSYVLSQDEADAQTRKLYKQARLNFLKMVCEPSMQGIDKTIVEQQRAYDKILKQADIDPKNVGDADDLKTALVVLHDTLNAKGNDGTYDNLKDTLAKNPKYQDAEIADQYKISQVANGVYRLMNDFVGDGLYQASISEAEQKANDSALQYGEQHPHNNRFYVDSVVRLTQSNGAVDQEFKVINILKQSSYQKIVDSHNDFDSARVASRMIKFDPDSAMDYDQLMQRDKEVRAKLNARNNPSYFYHRQLINKQGPYRFKAAVLRQVQQTLANQHIDAKPEDIKIDKNGLISWKGVKNTFDGTDHEHGHNSVKTTDENGQTHTRPQAVSGVVGQIFAPDWNNVVQTRYNELPNSPEDTNKTFVAGYRATYVEPKADEQHPGHWDVKQADQEFENGAGVNQRLRLKGLEQDALRQVTQGIVEQTTNRKVGNLTRPTDSTILNKLYHGDVALTQVDPESLKTKFYQDGRTNKRFASMTHENISAKLYDLSRRVKFSNNITAMTNTQSSANELNKMLLYLIDRKIADPNFDISKVTKGQMMDDLHDAYAKYGFFNHGVLSDDQNKGYFSMTSTSQGKNQGSVMFLDSEATVNADGTVTPHTENGQRVWGKSAIEQLPFFEYVAKAPFDRVSAAVPEFSRATAIDDHVNAAYLNLNLTNMEDGSVVSKNFAKRHNIKVGDKLSDEAHNKTTVSYIIDPDMDLQEANKLGIAQVVALFKRYPLDYVASPSSAISRKNMSAAYRMHENDVTDDLADGKTLSVPVFEKDENGNLIQNEDGSYQVSSYADTNASIAEIPLMVTDITVDSKSQVYSPRDIGRKFSLLLANSHMERGAHAVANELYDKDPKRLSLFREYLLVTGFDMLDDGVLTVRDGDIPNKRTNNQNEPDFKRKYIKEDTYRPNKQREQFKIDIPDDVNEFMQYSLQFAVNPDGELVYQYRKGKKAEKGFTKQHKLIDTNGRLNSDELKTFYDKYICAKVIKAGQRLERNGGFDAEQAFMRQIAKNGGNIVLPKVAGQQLRVRTSAGFWSDKISVLPPQARKNQELLDGTTTFSDFSRYYASIGLDLYRYKVVMETLSKNLPNGLQDAQRKQLLQQASKQLAKECRIQSDYDRLADGVGSKMLGKGSSHAIKHSYLRERIASTHISKSATLVMTNGAPDVPLDTVELSPKTAAKLGYDFDPKTGEAWIKPPFKKPQTNNPAALRSYQKKLNYYKKNMNYIHVHRDPVWSGSGSLGFKVRVNPRMGLTGARINPVVVSLMDGDYDGDQIGLFTIRSKAGQKELHTKLSVARNLLRPGTLDQDVPESLMNISAEFVDLAARTNYKGANDPKVWQKFADNFNATHQNHIKITNPKQYLNAYISTNVAKYYRKAQKEQAQGYTTGPDTEYQNALRFVDNFTKGLTSQANVMNQAGVDFKDTDKMWDCYQNLIKNGVKGHYSLDEQGQMHSADLDTMKQYFDYQFDDPDRIDKVSEVAYATKAKSDATGIPGHYQQMLVGAFRQFGSQGMLVADIVGKTFTQATLQVKHDSVIAKRLVDVMAGPLKDIYDGRDTNPPQFFGLMGSGKDDLPTDLLKASKIASRVFLYADKHGINKPTSKFNEQQAKEVGVSPKLANKIITGVYGGNVVNDVVHHDRIKSKPLNPAFIPHRMKTLCDMVNVGIPDSVLHQMADYMTDHSPKGDKTKSLQSMIRDSGTTFDKVNMNGFNALGKIAKQDYQDIMQIVTDDSLTKDSRTKALSKKLAKSSLFVSDFDGVSNLAMKLKQEESKVVSCSKSEQATHNQLNEWLDSHLDDSLKTDKKRREIARNQALAQAQDKVSNQDLEAFKDAYGSFTSNLNAHRQRPKDVPLDDKAMQKLVAVDGTRKMLKIFTPWFEGLAKKAKSAGGAKDFEWLATNSRKAAESGLNLNDKTEVRAIRSILTMPVNSSDANNKGSLLDYYKENAGVDVRYNEQRNQQALQRATNSYDASHAIYEKTKKRIASHYKPTNDPNSLQNIEGKVQSKLDSATHDNYFSNGKDIVSATFLSNKELNHLAKSHFNSSNALGTNSNQLYQQNMDSMLAISDKIDNNIRETLKNQSPLKAYDNLKSALSNYSQTDSDTFNKIFDDCGHKESPAKFFEQLSQDESLIKSDQANPVVFEDLTHNDESDYHDEISAIGRDTLDSLEDGDDVNYGITSIDESELKNVFNNTISDSHQVDIPRAKSKPAAQVQQAPNNVKVVAKSAGGPVPPSSQPKVGGPEL